MQAAQQPAGSRSEATMAANGNATGAGAAAVQQATLEAGGAEVEAAEMAAGGAAPRNPEATAMGMPAAFLKRISSLQLLEPTPLSEVISTT